MAKRLCGTADRLYQAGLLGLCSCIWRAASSPPTRIVSEILQRSSHPLGAEQGCTGSASSPSCWQHNCQAAPRRITPSIRSNLICGRDSGCPQAYFNGNKIVDVCSRQGWEDDMPVRNPRQHDVWTAGDAYEPFVGRWSRRAARELIAWLALAANSRWLDVGCGTGALTQTILTTAAPCEVLGVDPSEGFVAYARDHTQDSRAKFEVGNAQALPVANRSFDVAVAVPSVSHWA